MLKSKLLSGGLLIFLAGVLLHQACVGTHPAKDQLYDDFGNWLDQRVFADHDLDARRIAVKCFVHRALDIEAAYVANQLTLEESVDKVLAASLELWPEHLHLLACYERGNTHQERIARHIARHVEEDQNLSRHEVLLERVRAELAELLTKYQEPLQSNSRPMFLGAEGCR